MHFREDNSKALRQKLKEDDKAAYGVIKSLLSMDSNADVYDRTDSQFFSSGESMWQHMLKTSRKLRNLSF